MSELQYTHEDYTIGWVCALPNEQAAALFMLDEKHGDLSNPPNDQNAYTLGSIGKHKVVIAGLPKGRYGNTSSATVATRMINTFPNLRFGLMVGIGGGIPQKTRLGDVVISCPSGSEPGVVQWDMGKTEHDGQFRRTGALAPPPTALLTALGKFEADMITSRAKMQSYLKHLGDLPNVPKSFLKSDSLKDVLYRSEYGHVQGDDCAYCDENMIQKREPREEDMMIHCGLIASGNQVIKDAILRDSLYQKFDKNVLCVEMEAAGLMNDFPCVVIRGICDYADSHKNKQWQDYSATVAAACAKALLTVVPASEVDKLQRVQVSFTPQVLQGAKKYVSQIWGGDKTGTSITPTSPASTASTASIASIASIASTEPPEKMANGSGGEISQTLAPDTAKSKDKSSDMKPTEGISEEKSRETSSDTNISLQTPLELWIRTLSTSLVKMIQEGHAAIRSMITSATQLRIPQEGNFTSQCADWKNNPQTPLISPRHGSYSTKRDCNCRHDMRDCGSRGISYGATQSWPTYSYREASTQTYPSQEDLMGMTYKRSQTYPRDARSNVAIITQMPQPTRHDRSDIYDKSPAILDDHHSKSPARSPVVPGNTIRRRNFENLGELEHVSRNKAPAQATNTGGGEHAFAYKNGLSTTLGASQRQQNLSNMSDNAGATARQSSDNRNQGREPPNLRLNHANTYQDQATLYISQVLFQAVDNGDIASIEILLKEGANLEMIDGAGLTPLWHAAQSGRREIFQLLIEKGAKTEAHNASGQTILAWAVDANREDIINMLGFQ